MERKILLPTDFSDNSWSAIVYALKLYADEFCTFYILNSTTLKTKPTASFTNKLLKSMKEDAMIELLKLKEQTETANANTNHTFKIILSSESLLDALKTAVEKYDINLVLTATKGATGAKGFFLGSNTTHILKNLRDCPVLVVPEEYDFITPKQIAFPTDFKRFYDEKELKPLKQLADLFNSKIKVLHITIEEELTALQEYNLNMLKDYLQDYDCSFHWMPNYATKTIEINHFIEELEINVLFMVNYKHSIIEKLINEQVIKKIGLQLNIPFLVISD